MNLNQAGQTAAATTMLTDLFKLQMDLLGARGELAVGMLSSCIWNKVTPHGGGNRPVITFPGFLASGNTLLRLNRYLNRHGFEAQSWGLGRNLGPQETSWGEQLDNMIVEVGGTIQKLADKHSAPVSLIGQSLGGVYARELALQMPDLVDRVIMLGSPSFHPYLTTHVNRVVSTFGYWMNRQSHAELAGRSGLLHWDADRPALPCVSIHSPLDGVVDEASSIIPQYIVEQSDNSAPRENLRVLSSHIGMSVNPWVLLAIADRLVQDRDDWQVFDPYNYYSETLQFAVSRLYPEQDSDVANTDITTLAESG
jgi:pimeloyl-ACP methyl ester carboxylesterase